MRDLWALRLQRVQSKVSYDSDTDTERPSQQFSSQSEAETTDTESSRRGRRRRKQKASDSTPSLLDLLGLCYVGMLLLREPVTVADIFSWVRKGELLYYWAARKVPLGMRERLPGVYQVFLEPRTVLQPMTLLKKTLELLKLFGGEFGMSVPPINHTLVLYRWLRQLLLPIEVFTVTQRLAKFLGVDFCWAMNTKAGSLVAFRSPEVRLMALVVITTKLLFPFDDIERTPLSAEDPPALSFDWSQWVRIQSEEGETRLRFDRALDLSEADIMDLADDKLDDYLDWYQDNIATEEIRERGKAGEDADFRRTLLRLFPTTPTGKTPSTSSSRTVTAKLQEMQQTLKARLVVPEDEEGGSGRVNRMGSFYRRFRSEAELEGPIGRFYEEAAKLAGLGLRDLVRVVFSIERMMQKKEEKLRKGKLG